MLVLVAGATGNIGQKILASLIRHGHQARALGRNPDKLPSRLHAQLESFVTSTSYYDIPALDAACRGVDAVICAYNGTPELQVEGHMLLLRATERAGVRVFVPASWTAGWQNMRLGQQESYDPFIMLRRQIEISSDIRPSWIITGILAEVLFSAPGRVSFTPAFHGSWDGPGRRVEVWGDPAVKWQWTTEGDAADGGWWTVASGQHSLVELAETYGKVRGCDMKIEQMGSVEELRERARAARAEGKPNAFWYYIGYYYILFMVDGTYHRADLDNDRLGIKGTCLEKFLQDYPEV
ncbi:NAD(P)-binding protein [Xylariaceae sp. FL0016]|nr:NAD(P)-binding protein [Xylariaceae sp. FL0016]